MSSARPLHQRGSRVVAPRLLWDSPAEEFVSGGAPRLTAPHPHQECPSLPSLKNPVSGPSLETNVYAGASKLWNEGLDEKRWSSRLPGGHTSHRYPTGCAQLRAAGNGWPPALASLFLLLCLLCEWEVVTWEKGLQVEPGSDQPRTRALSPPHAQPSGSGTGPPRPPRPRQARAARCLSPAGVASRDSPA